MQTREERNHKKKLYLRKWRKTEKGKQCTRKWNLRRLFGVTEEEYATMLVNQNGGCAICGTTDPRGSGRFHIDHCHETGKIRGLLCWPCNSMLGMAKDDVTILTTAVGYLQKERL